MDFKIYFIGVFLIHWEFVSLGLGFQQSIWKEKYTLDSAVPGHTTTSGSTSGSCAISCSLSNTCLAFGFSADSHTCWLYDHLVPYTTNGTAAPGTRYFWRLSPRCPTELGYTLEKGICFRVSNSTMAWSAVHKACLQEGAHGLIADTAEKVAMLLPTADGYFLGAYDWKQNGDWRWVDGTPLPLNSTLWEPGEPNNFKDREFILHLADFGKFTDIQPQSWRRAACQIPII